MFKKPGFGTKELETGHEDLSRGTLGKTCPKR